MNIHVNLSSLSSYRVNVEGINNLKSEEERSWISKAIEDIKNPDTIINIQERLSRHVDTLNSFTPEQIFSLINILYPWIRQETPSQLATTYLTHEIASLIIKKDVALESYRHFLKQAKDQKIVIDVLIEQIKADHSVPIGLRGLLYFGFDPHTSEGKQALIDIIKLAAQKAGETTSKYIRDYGIDTSKPENQQELIEIAKIAAEQDGMGTSRYIKNYGIDRFPEGQKILIEIAKLVAQNDGRGISQFIQKYGIDTSTPEGQQALIEIAKLAAQQNGEGISQFIQNYGIDSSTPTGQQALIEIAKLAAQQRGWGTSRHIKNYGIDTSTPEGQKALIEIAKLAAQQNGWGASRYIQNYGIDATSPQGQQALIEIAKLSAQQDGLRTSEFIQNYAIDKFPDSQQALIEIAKLAAQQSAQGIVTFINFYPLDRFSIEGKQRFEELCNFIFICLVRQFSSFSCSQYYNHFRMYVDKMNGNGFKDYHVNPTIFDYPLLKLIANDIERAVMDSTAICAVQFDIKTQEMLWVKNLISEAGNMDLQKEILEWFMGLASLCTCRKDLKSLFKEQQSLFKQISSLSPELRTAVSKELIASTLDANSPFIINLQAELSKKSSFKIKKISVLPKDLRNEITNSFIRGCYSQQAIALEPLKKAAGDIVHAQLACFVLSEYPAQGKEVCLSVVNKIKLDRNFRQAKYQQTLLEVIIAIKNSSLDDAFKISLLDSVFNIPINDRLFGLRLLVDILNFKGDAYLREATDLAQMKTALEKLFLDKCKIHLENFSTLYENSIGTWRNKQALVTYASKHTSNPSVLPYFQDFLTAVLNGNFQAIRYATDNNHHLAEIQQHYPKIFEQWKLSTALKDGELEAKEAVKEIPIEKRVVDALIQAVENNHLGLERQEALFPILAACKGKWEHVEEPLDSISREISPLLGRRLTEEEMDIKVRLQIQKVLLELIKDSKDLEKKLNILKGLRIQHHNELMNPFYRDLEDAIH